MINEKLLNTEVLKQKIIAIFDEALQSAFKVSFESISGKLKPNTSSSLYAGFIVYYLKHNLKLKASTIGTLLNKSHDKIIIQYIRFAKHIEIESTDKHFINTIAKDRKELVDLKYPKFLAHLKMFALDIFAIEYENSLKKIRTK